MPGKTETANITNNWGLIGHEWAVGMLRQHLKNDALRNAYLFCGSPGLGRRTLALRLTQALNCLEPLGPDQPCGKCRSCRQVENMQYPDLTVVQADKTGGTLKVEQVRSLRQSLVLKPYQGSHRVALFLRFQEANANAANALLKTLEEAPSHVVLILTADAPELLLPTIVSRCEILRLRPLPVEQLETVLKKRGADADSAHLLAHISGGRPGYALNLMQNRADLEFRTRRLDDLRTLLGSNRRGRFAFAEKLTDRRSEGRERLRDTLLLWLAFWRDVLLTVTGQSDSIANVDRAAEIEELARRFTLHQAHSLVESAQGSLDKLDRNVNSRLLVEVLLMDWPKIWNANIPSAEFGRGRDD
jgi:DNA polymerase-3 subunit delta'